MHGVPGEIDCAALEDFVTTKIDESKIHNFTLKARPDLFESGYIERSMHNRLRCASSALNGQKMQKIPTVFRNEYLVGHLHSWEEVRNDILEELNISSQEFGHIAVPHGSDEDHFLG